jgi:hydroxymethylpyrimidine/phosphomethylpyrimidine kinase
MITLLTPNLREAEVLTGISIKTPSDYVKAGQILLESGLERVLIKGGHSQGHDSNDLLMGPDGQQWFKRQRVDTNNTHGTGCTLSSAIAACLARGEDLESSIKVSKLYVTGALENSINLGHGAGPLNHFYHFYAFGQSQ